MEKTKLIEEAKKAMEHSYSPYSNFKVGAALLTKDGHVYHGANVENASYGLCMCAERNALYNAMMDGYHKEDFDSLVVIGNTEAPISPCGACRQVMSELFPAKSPVIMTNLKGDIQETTVSELLPFAFTDSDL